MNTQIDEGVTITEVHISTRSYQTIARNSAVRMYVWTDDETMLENFANRFDRPTKLYRKAIPAALAELGIAEEDCGRIVWSQQAGCNCGCSPGFVLRGMKDGGRNHPAALLEDSKWGQPFDIHVTLTIKDTPEMTERAAGRLAQLGATL